MGAYNHGRLCPRVVTGSSGRAWTTGLLGPAETSLREGMCRPGARRAGGCEGAPWPVGKNETLSSAGREVKKAQAHVSAKRWT